jgi:DNA-binding NtrC family response regulator
VSLPIVYVDDEPLLCRVYQSVLRQTGFPVRTFTDPNDALEFIRANAVCLIVSDYRMPQMTGLDLLDRIEADVPFIMVSGDLSVARWVHGNPRVIEVLTKPFRPEQLLELVREHLPVH